MTGVGSGIETLTQNLVDQCLQTKTSHQELSKSLRQEEFIPKIKQINSLILKVCSIFLNGKSIELV